MASGETPLNLKLPGIPSDVLNFLLGFHILLFFISIYLFTSNPQLYGTFIGISIRAFLIIGVFKYILVENIIDYHLGRETAGHEYSKEDFEGLYLLITFLKVIAVILYLVFTWGVWRSLFPQ